MGVWSAWHRQECPGGIAAHPFDKLRAGSCKKRKDGAPSVEMVQASIIKDGPPARKSVSCRSASSEAAPSSSPRSLRGQGGEFDFLPSIPDLGIVEINSHRN